MGLIKEAETKYSLRYTTFTGDGDSSVYSSLVTQVQGWRHAECTSHTVKCYRGVLENLVAEKPGYMGRGKLMLAMRNRLTTAAHCAIKMRSTESDATWLLHYDLINSPRHCFGMHSDCSTDYCKDECSTQVSPTLGTAEAGILGTAEGDGSEGV